MSDSLFRQLTYKALKNVSLDGRVLDLGGSRGAYYHTLVVRDGDITIVNIDEKTKPDSVFDLDNGVMLPIIDNQHDGVLLINVLEHIYRYNNLLKESFRVLKPGGRLLAVVPFLHQIHPSPNDYFRYTKQALEELLKDVRFQDIKIQEIGGGVFSATHNFFHRFLPSFVSVPLDTVASVLDKGLLALCRKLGKHYTGTEYPLGYLIQAAKR